MARISTDDLDTIRTTVPLADIAGEHLALKRSGSSLKGLCPFHDERTPSFNINPSTNLWHCFGCDESGDVIDFVQRIEGEGFRWAVQYLADRYSIRLRDVDDHPDDVTNASRLIAAHEIAVRAYTHSLRHDPQAQPARDLLHEREFDLDIAIDQFGCGFAPTTRALHQLLSRNGFTHTEIVDSGLATETRNGLRDQFAGRLVWTITNSFGKPIGFGARKLFDHDQRGKYINTTETHIYKKSQVLYGLHLARKEITRTGQAIVVEGYTDVMAMHMAGHPNTVAACGTALTGGHIATLRRLVGDTGEIVLGFDDDDAGHRAASSAYKAFNATVRRLTTLPSSDGMDPDELRRERGDAALTDMVQRRTPLIHALLTHTLATLPQETPEDRAAALDAVLPFLSDIEDQLVRHDYAVEVATTLRFNPDQVERRATPRSTPGPAHVDPVDPGGAADWVEKEVLRTLAQDETLARHYLADDELDDAFTQAPSRAALQLLRSAIDAANTDHTPWPLHLRAQCSSDQDRRLVGALTAEALPIGQDAAVDYADELLARLYQRQHRRISDQLRATVADAASDSEKAAALDRLIAHQRAQPKVPQ